MLQVIRPAIVLYLFAVFMTSLCTTYWQLMLAQGVATGIGNGLLLFPSLSAPSQYFHKRRGAMLGLAITGSSVGAIVFPILLGRLLNGGNGSTEGGSGNGIGFGWTVRISAFVMAPVLAFSAVAIRARLPPRASRFLLPEAWRSPLFTLLVGTNFFLFATMLVPLFFIPTYAVVRSGTSELLASYLVAVVNGASIPGRILPGVLSDRLGRLNMLLAAGAATTIIVFCWPAVETNAGIIVFAAFFGFCSGAIISGGATALSLCPPTPQDIGTYTGMGMAVAATGSLMGPPVVGALLKYDLSFRNVSYFCGALGIVGTLLVLFAKMNTKAGLLGRV